MSNKVKWIIDTDTGEKFPVSVENEKESNMLPGYLEIEHNSFDLDTAITNNTNIVSLQKQLSQTKKELDDYKKTEPVKNTAITETSINTVQAESYEEESELHIHKSNPLEKIAEFCDDSDPSTYLNKLAGVIVAIIIAMLVFKGVKPVIAEMFGNEQPASSNSSQAESD